jgi:GMP synthase-like glutamine amidotransferase
VTEVYGPYFSGIFMSVLENAAQRLTLPSPVEITGWDAMNGQFPDLSTVDAIIVTGSMAGAYDTYPWIKPLADFIKLIYTKYPHVRIAGVCFGHQIICQTLLGPHGVIVEKHPGGFENGLQTVVLNPKLVEYFPGLRDYISTTSSSDGTCVAPQVRLQLGHGDHVVLPKPPQALPGRWLPVGSTQHCHVQGLFEPGRVLTTQPHWECDSFIMSESFKYLFTPEKGFSREEIGKWAESTKGEHDSLAMQESVLQFLLGMLPEPEAQAKA